MRASSSPVATPPLSPQRHEPTSGACGQADVGSPKAWPLGPREAPESALSLFQSVWCGGGVGSTAWPAGHCCPGLFLFVPWAFASGNLGSCAWSQPAHPPRRTHGLSLPPHSRLRSPWLPGSCHMCDPSPLPLPSCPAPGLGLTPVMPNVHPPPSFLPLMHLFLPQIPLTRRSPQYFIRSPGRTTLLPAGCPGLAV